MTTDVSKQLADILNEYDDKVKEVARKEAKKSGQRTARELRSASPKGPKGYAGGWASKQYDADTVVVYNKKMPGLAHLLEFGHVIRNKKGTYGRAPAHPHIKPVEAKNNEEYVDNVTRALGR